MLGGTKGRKLPTTFKKTKTIILFHYSIIPLFHYSFISLFLYSIIPLFHYSIIPFHPSDNFLTKLSLPASFCTQFSTHLHKRQSTETSLVFDFTIAKLAAEFKIERV